MWSLASCKPEGEAAIHDSQEFLIMKRNAQLARYSCCCVLRLKQLSVARFDSRSDSVVIGCREGCLLNGDFRKNGHFPSFIIIFGLLVLSSRRAKWHVDDLASAWSVTQRRLPLQPLTRGPSTHQDAVAETGSCPGTSVSLPDTVTYERLGNILAS